MILYLHRHNLTLLDNRGKHYRDMCLITCYFLTESCGNDWLDWPVYNNQETTDEFLERTKGFSNRTITNDAYKSTHKELKEKNRPRYLFRWLLMVIKIRYWLWTKICI